MGLRAPFRESVFLRYKGSIRFFQDLGPLKRGCRNFLWGPNSGELPIWVVVKLWSLFGIIP